MSDQFLAEIRIFPANKIPKEFTPCDGRLLILAQNTALFSLLSTTYGGDGVTNFALPNLSGRAALMAGAGAGLTEYALGEDGGIDAVTLTAGEIPQHTHSAVAKQIATSREPAGKLWSNPATVRPAPNFYASQTGTARKMHEKAIGFQGGSQAHNNLMPYTGFVFCIALDGYFPERG